MYDEWYSPIHSCVWTLAWLPSNPVSLVPPHVPEECFWVQAWRGCRGSSYSHPDYAWISHVCLKCFQYSQTSKLSMTRQDKEKISPDKINPAGQNKFHRLELIQLYMVWCFLLLSLFNLWNALKPKNILSVGWTRLMFFPPVERWLLYHVHRVDHVLFTYICKTSFNPPWAALAAHFFWAAEIAFLECNRKLGQRFALTECRRTVNPELICQEHVQHIQRESQRVFWLDNAITFRPDLFVYRPQEDPSSDSVTQKKKKKNNQRKCWCYLYLPHREEGNTGIWD